MNLSLRPHQLVAHWVPGFVLAILIPSAFPGTYANFVQPLLPRGEAARALLLVVLAFVLGEFLDAVRDNMEHVWDKRSEVWWDFFFDADPAEVEKLDNYYFTYYVFNANLVLPLASYSVAQLLSGNLGISLALMVAACIFLRDAFLLRRDVARLTRQYRDRSRKG